MVEVVAGAAGRAPITYLISPFSRIKRNPWPPFDARKALDGAAGVRRDGSVDVTDRDQSIDQLLDSLTRHRAGQLVICHSGTCP